MRKRRNLVAELMAETILYGGVLATRAEVYDHVIACGHGWRAADMFACGRQAVVINPAEHPGRRTLKEVLESERK